jgi:flagellar hook-associated protein 3 FlgL
VDASSIAPGFSGSVDITADGTLSLDGGQTSLPIDFSQNQTLVDESGNVRHVDSQGITQVGVDTVQLKGNSDLFETLRSMRDDLLHYEDFTAEEWDAVVTDFLGDMDSANNHLLNVVGEQSVDLQTLDRLQDRGDELQLESQKRLAELQGTDFTSAVLQLQEEQNLTEYTFATLSGVFQVSVLDFLR